MHPNLLVAVKNLEAASAALLDVVVTSKEEPLIALLVIPVIEVVGPLAARVQLIHEAVNPAEDPSKTVQ